MSLFASYAKLKRKTFWVMRYVEVTSEGILVYRDRKEDKQNKAEFRLSNCKVKELSTNNGFQIQFLHGDDSLKIMAHTNQEHKKLVQAITQIKQKSEQKQEIQVQAQEQQQIRSTIVPSIIIQQVKPPTFQPDQDLVKQTQGDQIKMQALQLIKKFETHQLTLINVIDGIFFYKTEKTEKNNDAVHKKSKILNLIQEEIKNVGYLLQKKKCYFLYKYFCFNNQSKYNHLIFFDILIFKDKILILILKLFVQNNQLILIHIKSDTSPVTIAIAIIFFTLMSILIYLLLSLVDNRTYTNSILITLNLIILPLLFRNKSTPKEVEKTQQFLVQCKCIMNVDYNALVYLISKFEIRKDWTPNLLLINNDNNLITALYQNQKVEKFNQLVFYDEDTFYIVEHFNLLILRLFVVKYLFDEENIEVRCITDNTQMQILPCLKQFTKIQKQNPKSILIEYQASKASSDQISVIQSEIIYKLPDYSKLTQSPNQQRQNEQQVPLIPSNSPRQIQQIQQSPQQPLQPQQQYPPEIQRIFDIEETLNLIQIFQNSFDKQIHLSISLKNLTLYCCNFISFFLIFQPQNIYFQIKTFLFSLIILLYSQNLLLFCCMTIEAKKQLDSVYPLGPSWQQKDDKGGFLIHTRFDEATGQTMSRGEGILPYSIQEIFEIIEKVERRGDYDSLFDSGYMVKKLDPDTGIVLQKPNQFRLLKISKLRVLVQSFLAAISKSFQQLDKFFHIKITFKKFLLIKIL